MAQQKTNQKEAKAKLMDFLAAQGMDIQQEISICLSDIPKDRMSKSSKGKIYCNIVIGMRKEPDQWGRDLKVYMQPTQKDKEEKANKVYVGGGKTFIFAQNSTSEPSQADVDEIIPPEDAEKKDDLPF